VQADTAGPEDQGFGWLIPHEDGTDVVATVGHGGQMLLIDRARRIVLVTAGSGVEPARVADPLLDALASPDRPLLGDPDGAAGLAAAVGSVAAGPGATAVRGPTGMIRRLSGVTWVIDPNPLGIERLRLDLRDAEGAGMASLGSASDADDLTGPIGLDGRYRIALDVRRHPVALRGSWVDDRTFALEVDACADGRAYTLRLIVAKDGNHVTVEGLERGHATGFVVEGARAG
jgi:hypothetical protein